MSEKRRNYLLRWFDGKGKRLVEEEWDSLEGVQKRYEELRKRRQTSHPLFWWQVFEMRELDERQVFLR
jgi:hypothetical protein